MSSEAVALLRAIDDKLARIITMIETRTVKRPASRRSRYAKQLAEAQEALMDQAIPRRVRELWAEICPDCPQPVQMDADRRQRARAFWQRLGGEEGVRSVFLTVAADDWLCGRVVRSNGRTARRHRGVGLFEVIDHCAEIIEGTYR